MAAVFQKCKSKGCEQTRCGHPWTVRYREPGGRSARQREQSFPRKREADQFATSTEDAKYAGVYRDPELGKITVGECAERRLAEQINLRDKTRGRVEQFYRKWLLPQIGSLPVARVRTDDVQRVVDEMRKHLAASSIETNYLDIAALFNWVVAKKWIAESPCRGVVLPERESRAVDERELPTMAEVGGLATAMGEDGLIVWLMFGLGLRLGEALGVDLGSLSGDRLRLRHQIGRWGDSWFAPLKHRRAGDGRDIPLPPAVANRVDRHVDLYGVNPVEGRSLLFRSAQTGVVTTRMMSNRWTRRVAGAGYKYTPHDLRHLFATTALADNVPIHEVSRWLGHRSIQITVDTYGHLTPDAHDRCRSALERALNRC